MSVISKFIEPLFFKTKPKHTPIFSATVSFKQVRPDRANSDATRRANTGVPSYFQVTIVGYGRYGNHYIGPKYAKRGYPWEVKAVIDPSLNSARFGDSVLGQEKPDILVFLNFTDWYEHYFKHLDDDKRRRQVVEIALKPELVYEQAIRFINVGVKQLILPKPVVVNQRQLLKLVETVEKHQVKVAVASQWHYSDFPKIIRREINHMTQIAAGSNPKLVKVEVEFSKENGLAYHTSPPLLELPHVLQLLASIGLVDFDQHRPEVSGTNTQVEVVYRPHNVRRGVRVRADVDWQPASSVKRKYPQWDVQERKLKIFLTDDHPEAALEVDFWIKFDRSGDAVIRPGQLTVRENIGTDQAQALSLNFVEDQLLNMNRKIYGAFGQEFRQFQNDHTILSLECYQSIGNQIMWIQHEWESAIVPHPVRTQKNNGQPRYRQKEIRPHLTGGFSTRLI